MSKEIHKASIQYHIGHLVSAAVIFTIMFAIIYIHASNYRYGWFWSITSCVLIISLYNAGKIYKRRKIEMEKALDRVFKLN